MKKVLAMCILTAMVLTLFSGCGKKFTPDTSPEYKFGLDCQSHNFTCSGCGVLAETETSIYYHDGAYLRVIDKKTMTDAILCGKPDCLHDQDDNGQTMEELGHCNAYLNISPSTTTSYYDGAIYVIRRGRDPITREYYPVIVKVSLDGSSQKEIWEVDWGNDYDSNTDQLAVFHRGKVYFLSTPSRLNPKTGEREYLGEQVLYSYDLKTGKKKELLRHNYEKEGYLGYLYAIGGSLYAPCTSLDTPDTHMIRFDLAEGKKYFLENYNGVYRMEDQLLEYSLDFRMNGEEKSWKHSLFVSDLDGRNRRPYENVDLNDVPEWVKQIQVIGSSLYVMDSSGIPLSTEIRVYDLHTGEKTATLELPSCIQGEGGRMMTYTTDGKFVVYSLVSFDERGNLILPQFAYCDIDDIGTPDFQWHEVQRIN